MIAPDAGALVEGGFVGRRLLRVFFVLVAFVFETEVEFDLVDQLFLEEKYKIRS